MKTNYNIIMNHSTSNSNLFFFSNVSDYNYFCSVIKLRNNITCNSLLPNTLSLRLFKAAQAESSSGPAGLLKVAVI